MKKIACLSLVLVASSLSSMDLVLVKALDNKIKMNIEAPSLFVPSKLGELNLSYGKKGFTVVQDNQKFVIKKCFTDPILHNINQKQLSTFLKEGYLSINRMDDGEFSLKAKGRVKGGGPILGAAAYWVTKSLCYGTIVAATGTVTVASGGLVGAAVGAAVGAGTVGTVAAAATATAISTTAGVVTGTATMTGAVVGAGATIVSSAITTAGVTSQAALVTGAVASAGGVAATIAGIESFSVAVGSFFGMLPTI